MVVVRELRICPVCDMRKKIDIPVWREDVEGWGYEIVSCPVCNGEGALDKAGWAEKYSEFKAHATFGSGNGRE